jgi:hypothetical protein
MPLRDRYSRQLYVHPWHIYIYIYIYIYIMTFLPVFRSWPLLSRTFEITFRHSTLGRILRTSDQTLRPLPGNTQQTDIHDLGGIRTPIPASERTQTHALYRPATGISFSIIYTLNLALRRKSIYWNNTINHKRLKTN